MFFLDLVCLNCSRWKHADGLFVYIPNFVGSNKKYVIFAALASIAFGARSGPVDAPFGAVFFSGHHCKIFTLFMSNKGLCNPVRKVKLDIPGPQFDYLQEKKCYLCFLIDCSWIYLVSVRFLSSDVFFCLSNPKI